MPVNQIYHQSKIQHQEKSEGTLKTPFWYLEANNIITAGDDVNGKPYSVSQ
jgi:hypothetical protein